jgi:ketosteroid isomerase-like protein
MEMTPMPAAARTTEAAQPDHDTLLALNRDYISSVQNSDVRRFNEILADDFYCSNPDGSLVDRAAFLAQTARPVMIKDLAAEDVYIRLMGDFAIIHARTAYTKPDGTRGAGRYTDVSGAPGRRVARSFSARDTLLMRRRQAASKADAISRICVTGCGSSPPATFS